MNTIQKNENKNKSSVIRYLLYLLLVVSLVSGVAFSRYSSTAAGQDSARVATFAYEVAVELNDSDPEKRAKGEREFTSDSFLSTDVTPAKFDVSIYATSKLYEAGECEFDDVARVFDLKFSNHSEVKIRALLRSMTEMQENGIVWCLFNEEDFDSQKNIYDNIVKQLGYDSLSEVPDKYSALETELQDKNTDTLDAWDSSAALEPNEGTKTLTFVIWAEHDGVKDYADWDFTSEEGPFEQSIEIKFTVTQVD